MPVENPKTLLYLFRPVYHTTLLVTFVEPLQEHVKEAYPSSQLGRCPTSEPRQLPGLRVVGLTFIGFSISLGFWVKGLLFGLEWALGLRAWGYFYIVECSGFIYRGPWPVRVSPGAF